MLFIYHFFGELTLSLFIFGLLFDKLHIAKQCCEQAFKYQLTLTCCKLQCCMGI